MDCKYCQQSSPNPLLTLFYFYILYLAYSSQIQERGLGTLTLESDTYHLSVSHREVGFNNRHYIWDCISQGLPLQGTKTKSGWLELKMYLLKWCWGKHSTLGKAQVLAWKIGRSKWGWAAARTIKEAANETSLLPPSMAELPPLPAVHCFWTCWGHLLMMGILLSFWQLTTQSPEQEPLTDWRMGDCEFYVLHAMLSPCPSTIQFVFI